ncbi:MAG: Flp pilus assembly complex ATPase component TadA [Desulfovibrio sp.]|nr:Flp pilus assembly complex ATPase component TadA [Desulfovibrio sp.]
MSESLHYPGELAHTVNQAMLDRFLLWAVEKKASDVVLRASDPPWIQVDGRWYATSEHFVLSASETQLLTNLFSGQEHKAGNVQRGLSADFAYSLRVPEKRGLVQRFRVNVTASNAGHYLVLRTLPTHLPTLSDLTLDSALWPKLYPENGMVIISGVMGCGKSTLLAGLLHSAILRRSSGGLGLGRQILTLEEPIEFDLGQIPHALRSAPIAQSEIPGHVQDWAGGVRSMTRRKGEMVMVGEARDSETLGAMLQIVEQGVTCYATVHAKDVSQTITRIIHSFPEEERAQVASVLKANLRVILHQRLVPRADGAGRMPLREYLVFDEAIRLSLYATPYAELIAKVRGFVWEKGHPLLVDARAQYQAKRISREVYASICDEQRGLLPDVLSKRF